VFRRQRITSRQHAVVRRFRSAAAGRDDGVVLLDGEHLLLEALDAGLAIDLVLTETPASPLADRAEASGADVYQCSAAVLAAASPVKTPSGLVALARWRPAATDAVLAGDRPLAIALVGVQDPGNVGAAIRAAAALGATGVAVLEDSADPGGWRALRGAMGSTFRVPVARGAAADIVSQARGRGLRVAAATARDGVPIALAGLREPVLVLFGNEGAGLPSAIEAGADLKLAVPMERGVESLNVAVTAALILFEARRQRAARTRS
jgi:TrmH family RNA methyltransferase